MSADETQVPEVEERPASEEEIPEDDPYVGLSEEELHEALLAARERTRAYHAMEEARAQERAPQASLVDVLPTAEEIRARAEESQRIEAERERKRIEREPELRRIKAEGWVDRCRALHARFASATLDQLGDAARNTLDGWIDDDSPGTLMIVGGVGTGKTYAAFAAMREMYLHGATVKFWPVPKLLDALRPSGEGAADAVAREAVSVDVLVLDDIGSERATDWSMERLYILVNDRWMAGRRMIVTSNLDSKSLLEAIGERMFSRFIDGGHMLNTGSGDRRKPK